MSMNRCTELEVKVSDLTHLDENDCPGMVNVGAKAVTQRIATAESILDLPPELAKLILDGDIQSKKGSVIQTAVLAGTMAVKRTSDLIPLCHPLLIESCSIHIDLQMEPNGHALAHIRCEVGITGRTGVEMEALTGATVAALTMYDMCKAVTHNMRILETRLIQKSGGKRLIEGGRLIRDSRLPASEEEKTQ
jgi:cyclic pyranopterin monophosphate synthase